MAGGTLNLDLDKLARAFGVANDCLRQLNKHLPQRIYEQVAGGCCNAAGTGSDQQAGVVGRGVSVNGYGIETVIHHFPQQVIDCSRIDHGVGCDISQHGCHVRLYHAGPFGHAGDGDRLTLDLNPAADSLGQGICCHDTLGSVQPGPGIETL